MRHSAHGVVNNLLMVFVTAISTQDIKLANDLLGPAREAQEGVVFFTSYCLVERTSAAQSCSCKKRRHSPENKDISRKSKKVQLEPIVSLITQKNTLYVNTCYSRAGVHTCPWDTTRDHAMQHKHKLCLRLFSVFTLHAHKVNIYTLMPERLSVNQTINYY